MIYTTNASKLVLALIALLSLVAATQARGGLDVTQSDSNDFGPPPNAGHEPTAADDSGFSQECENLMKKMMQATLGNRELDAEVGVPTLTRNATFGIVWRNWFKLPGERSGTRIVCWRNSDGAIEIGLFN